MIRKYARLPFLLLIFGLIFKPLSAPAQNCEILPALINTMPSADIGALSLWDRIHGTYPDQENWVSGVYEGKAARDMTMAGLSIKADKTKYLTIARLNYRGQVLWEKKHDIQNLSSVAKILKTPKGYVVLASTRNKKIQQPLLVFLNDKAEIVKTAAFPAQEVSQQAIDIVHDFDHQGFIIALDTLRRAEAPAEYDTQIIHADKNGKEIIKRSYRSGVPNKPHQLLKTKDKHIIVVGEAQDSQSRPAGWLMAVSKDLNILWDQIYPRGLEARLSHGAIIQGDQLIAAGSAKPSDTGVTASWVMRVDLTRGDTVWDRYFRSEQNFISGPALASGDGLVSIALQGTAAVKEDQKDEEQNTAKTFTRLTTLNPQGLVIYSEDYLSARALQVNDIFFGNNREHVMVGQTLSPDKMLKDEKGEPGYSWNAWAMGVPGTDPYQDPCPQWEGQ